MEKKTKQNKKKKKGLGPKERALVLGWAMAWIILQAKPISSFFFFLLDSKTPIPLKP